MPIDLFQRLDWQSGVNECILLPDTLILLSRQKTM